VGKQIFFRAGKGGSLWRSDGTTEGTLVVKHSSDARWLTAYRGALLFTAWDHASGYELWRSDGTVAGTGLVTDLRPGPDDASPFWLTVVDEHVLFSAWTEEFGREIWQTDGTQSGTRLLHDLVPGEGSSSPAMFTVVGPRVFFLANDGFSGVEPWVINDCVAPELGCPADLVAEATGPSGAAVAWPPPRVSDNKPASPTVTFSQSPGSTFPLGTTPITIIATDESGNKSSCEFNVAVRDTRPPHLICPPDQVIERTSRHGAVVNYPPAKASDDVSTPKVMYGRPPGTQFPSGQTVVRISATDAAGNRAQCTFQVSVVEPSHRGCGCGASASGGLSGWLLLMALSRFAWRRRKA
jgi:ELWxxDGT repeat protein